MEKNNYVLELGVEEIPAQYIATMADSMRENAKKTLNEQSLSYDRVRVLYTPRRMALLIDGLADSQPNQLLQKKGPAKKTAFNEKGEPSVALLGFLKKNDVTVDDIFTVSENNNEYVAISKLDNGKRTLDILGACMEKVILSIYNPNPMRWANFKIKFIRPIRWILSLYANKHVFVKLECAESSNFTYGHRTLANRAVEVKSADDYIQTLRDVFVLVDQDERRKSILTQVDAIEKKYHCLVEKDETLLEEINNLIEYPTVAMGAFEERYLSLPECVIKSPLKTQQRYFPVYKGGKIFNAFVFVRNGNSYNIDNVIAGNERVIRSRLADAIFFYDKDVETTLMEKAKKLEEVVFVNKLGSYADKEIRVTEIAKKFAKVVGFNDINKIETVGKLMKADLVSNLVREYTEIQGLAGGEFAKLEHFDEDMCRAISEQYLPNFLGDSLPSSNLSAIMSIADKIDTVMGLCAIGLKPTSSTDPYGLRRQVLGVFLVANDRLFNLDLERFIDNCAVIYRSFVDDEPDQTFADFVEFVKKFFLQRLKVFLHDQMKFTQDELNIVSLDDLNIYKSIKKVNLIRVIRDTEWYKSFMQIYKRIQNLIAGMAVAESERKGSVKDSAAEEMYKAYDDRKANIAQNIDAEDYEAAIKLIVECSEYINKFMENNRALSDDDDIRNKRVTFFTDFCGQCSRIIKIH